MTWEVITGDCLAVMPTLEAGSIDAIITDIPYGTTACSWDSVIPFEPMWAVIRHVLKPRGVFVTTASQPFTSALVMSNPKWFRYEWVWEKSRPSGSLHANNMPLRDYENVVVFCSGLPAYNPQMVETKRIIEKPRTVNKGAVNGNQKISRTFDNGGLAYPRRIIPFANHNAGSEHPTQKPVALYEYLIRTYTNEGETVLDMTAGSGTTGVAAINTGRNVILIEQREDYATIARARCEKAAEQARQMEMTI